MGNHYTRLLTVAGSDSGGGAGIQADLKTFMATGCYGMSVVTAVTAQNTCGVSAIFPISEEVIQAQLEAVLNDIGADGIKIGMLHSESVIQTVARSLKKMDTSKCPIVLDPVMVATSGDRLIEDDAVQALVDHLIPLAALITPNLPEAEVLLGRKISGAQELFHAAELLGRKLQCAVLLKGGHLEGDTVVDVLFDPASEKIREFTDKKIDTRNSHGTGCTLSAAIAAHLARGVSLADAVDSGRTYLKMALFSGADYEIGKGHGPVHHGWNI